MAVSAEQPRWARRGMWRCTRCGLWLILPLPVGVVLVLAQNLLPVSAHGGAGGEFVAKVLPALVFIAAFALGGGLWGQSMAQLFGLPVRAAAAAGALGYTLPLIGAAMILAQLEGSLTSLSIAGWKIHVVYGLLFVPTAFLIAAIAGGAVAATARDLGLTLKLALGGGAAAALGFLVVVAILDLVGMRVGAPGAEERLTMLTVTMTGMLVAALTGTWAWGLLLAGAARSGATPGPAAAA